MSIFNKQKDYIIVTNMHFHEAVRGFAEKHCADGCEIEVHAHGCLLDEDNLVEVKFTSTDTKDIIHSGLKDLFGEHHRLDIRRKLIFVLDKEEESE